MRVDDRLLASCCDARLLVTAAVDQLRGAIASFGRVSCDGSLVGRALANDVCAGPPSAPGPVVQVGGTRVVRWSAAADHGVAVSRYDVEAAAAGAGEGDFAVAFSGAFACWLGADGVQATRWRPSCLG